MGQHSIIFWNIQRLFDSKGSPIEHALSGGQANASNTGLKIKIIAAVIDCISREFGPPLAVGFAEIENSDLCQEIAININTAQLKAIDNMIKDETGFALEGLNLGLLLNEKLIDHVSKLRSHVIDRKFITRDILECDFQLTSGKKFSILINHWPSRMISEAANQRISAALYAADLFRSKTRFNLNEMWNQEKSILIVPNNDVIKQRALSPVVIMGDFNDEMFSESIQLLGSTNDKEVVLSDEKPKGRTKKERFQSYMNSSLTLYNPFWNLIGGVGSYYRTPRWRFYDQIMLSKGLLNIKKKPFFLSGTESIFSKKEIILNDGMTYTITNRNGKPISFDIKKNRGCSDHFPVYIGVEI